MATFLEDDGCNESQPLETIPAFDENLLISEELENLEEAGAARWPAAVRL